MREFSKFFEWHFDFFNSLGLEILKLFYSKSISNVQKVCNQKIHLKFYSKKISKRSNQRKEHKK